MPGLVLFRWDAPLFFANAEVFRDHVLQAIADAPTPTKWVIVAAEPVTDIDITAAEALSALDDDLKKFGIELCFAEMKDPVKDRLKRYDLFVKFGADQFFPTLGQAVDRYLEAHQVAWTIGMRRVDWVLVDRVGRGNTTGRSFSGIDLRSHLSLSGNSLRHLLD